MILREMTESRIVFLISNVDGVLEKTPSPWRPILAPIIPLSAGSGPPRAGRIIAQRTRWHGRRHSRIEYGYGRQKAARRQRRRGVWCGSLQTQKGSILSLGAPLLHRFPSYISKVYYVSVRIWSQRRGGDGPMVHHGCDCIVDVACWCRGWQWSIWTMGGRTGHPTRRFVTFPDVS